MANDKLPTDEEVERGYADFHSVISFNEDGSLADIRAYE